MTALPLLDAASRASTERRAAPPLRTTCITLVRAVGRACFCALSGSHVGYARTR